MSLCRPKDIGREKAVVAAEFVNSRVAGCSVTPYPNQESMMFLKAKFELLQVVFTVTFCTCNLQKGFHNPWQKLYSHFKKIQDYDADFYRGWYKMLVQNVV